VLLFTVEPPKIVIATHQSKSMPQDKVHLMV